MIGKVADDTNISRVVHSDEDCQRIQQDISGDMGEEMMGGI